MNYQDINKELQGRCYNSRKACNNTYYKRRGDDTLALLHHETDIITYTPDKVTLDCNGWRSVTTKQRLNEYSPAGVYVYQRQGIWYVEAANGKHEYFDGIELDYSGNVLNADNGPSTDYILERKRIQELIKSYCTGLRAHLKANGPMLDNSGDCWHCSMKTDSGESLGDASKDHSHLIQHLEENYYMASLNYNAVCEAGYNSPGFILQVNMIDGIVRAVREYLKKRLIK